MHNPKRAEVLIAGAGIGGLTAALSLHAVGIRPQIVESARTINAVGGGINLQPAAVRELAGLGLLEAIAAVAIETAELVRVDHFGRQLTAEPRGLAAGYAYPQYSVHRVDLQEILVAAVRDRLGPHALRTGARVQDVWQTTRLACASIVDRVAGLEEHLEAEVLVGADGIHSVVRARLHPDGPSLRWSQARTWRGVTETAPFLTGRSMIIAIDDLGSRLVAYPVSRRVAARGRSLTNWSALIWESEPGPRADKAGWNRLGRLEDVLPHFAAWRLGWLDVPELLAGSRTVREYPMLDRDPLQTWGRGRVTLLGDAAHPMTPVGSNGGTAAIVDAAVLARELAAAPDPVSALSRYEAARRDATTSLILANREIDVAQRAAARGPRSALAGELVAIADAYRRGTA